MPAVDFPLLGSPATGGGAGTPVACRPKVTGLGDIGRRLLADFTVCWLLPGVAIVTDDWTCNCPVPWIGVKVQAFLLAFLRPLSNRPRSALVESWNTKVIGFRFAHVVADVALGAGDVPEPQVAPACVTLVSPFSYDP